MKKLLLLVGLMPALMFGAANDIKVSQKNSTDTAWIDRIFQPSGSTVITTVATLRTGLGLGTGDSPTFTGITLSTGGSLGVSTATTLNGNTFTTGTGTLTLGAGKTTTFNHTSTFTTTDGQTYIFPTTTATLARTDAGQTFTGVQVFTSPTITTSITFAGGGSITESAGAIGINAGSSAKSITLTPTTTGYVIVGTGTGSVPALGSASSATSGFSFGPSGYNANETVYISSGTASWTLSGTNFVHPGAGIIRADSTLTFKTAAGGANTHISLPQGNSNVLIGGLAADDGATTLQGAASIVGLASNMTITSGTGNSRTMTLRTTTSGGTATNFLVADATQGVTLGSLAATGSRAVLADANGLLSAPVSDETWKQNIRALPEAMGLPTILALRPLLFNYKDKNRFGGQDYIGFGARATNSILPQVTGRDVNGTFYLTDEKLTAPLVLAVQQQQAQIAALSSGNADWPARLMAGLALILAIRANLRKK